MPKFILVDRAADGAFRAHTVEAADHDTAAGMADGVAVHVYPDLGESAIYHTVGESRTEDSASAMRTLRVERAA